MGQLICLGYRLLIKQKYCIDVKFSKFVNCVTVKKRKPSQTDASVFKKADARFRKAVPPESVPCSHGPGGGNGVGVAGLNRG